MNFSTTTYKINDFTVNKVTIEHGWVMVYDNTEKIIITSPVEVSNSILETTHEFCVKDTEDELLDIIEQLKLSKIENSKETIIDKAIKETSEYISNK